MKFVLLPEPTKLSKEARGSQNQFAKAGEVSYAGGGKCAMNALTYFYIC
jgi:hypothetical protein